jgi:hypothetical protein
MVIHGSQEVEQFRTKIRKMLWEQLMCLVSFKCTNLYKGPGRIAVVCLISTSTESHYLGVIKHNHSFTSSYYSLPLLLPLKIDRYRAFRIDFHIEFHVSP